MSEMTYTVASILKLFGKKIRISEWFRKKLPLKASNCNAAIVKN